MQSLLSYDQSPPLAAPFRFFLTAPLFTILAGMVLLCYGPDMLASRWTPGVLALTHLVTAGFMLQVMLGAMIQVLPVVAGANMLQPLWISRGVHVALTAGCLTLAAAFMSFDPWLFMLAALLLGGGSACFVALAAFALYGIPATSPTVQGLKYALVGLAVALGLGVLLSFSIGLTLDIPLLQIADVHMVWGFVAWGLVLVSAVAYVVVPMFQLTPAYPETFARIFIPACLCTVLLWSVFYLFIPGIPSFIARLGIAGLVISFSGLTLLIQRRSKRPTYDVSQRYWMLAMFSLLASSGVGLVSSVYKPLADEPQIVLAGGVLVIFGSFVSVISGMLYKIVPFLIWLHLQNQGRGKVTAPNMKKIISERAMHGQMLSHFVSCGLLLLGVLWPSWFAYPAGIGLALSGAWLLANLYAAMRVYRQHQLVIREKLNGVLD